MKGACSDRLRIEANGCRSRVELLPGLERTSTESYRRVNRFNYVSTFKTLLLLLMRTDAYQKQMAGAAWV